VKYQTSADAHGGNKMSEINSEDAQQPLVEVQESNNNSVALAAIIALVIITLACILSCTVMTVAFLINAPW
jgi:hypothetical protein